MLIGIENICFTYSRDERNHKCFFSRNIRQEDVLELLPNKSSNTDIISCAKILQSNIKLFKLPLEESVCDANAVATCQSNVVVPDSWHIFMKHLCGDRSNSDDLNRKFMLYFN